MKPGYVYIMTNAPHGTLYIGVTSDINRRDYEHKNAVGGGFSKKYHLTLLVHVETYDAILEAIAREKQLKAWRRDWKIDLINAANPEWKNIDLI